MSGLRERMLVGIAVPGALAFALAACAGPPAAPPGDGSPWDVELVGVDAGDIDCVAELDAAWGIETPGADADDTDEAPAPVHVSDDVEAVAVLRCTQIMDPEQPDGIETARMVTVLERLEGDVDAVIAALSKPDEPLGGPDTVCMAMMEMVRPLWIVQPDGSAVRVHVPRDRCGFTLPGTWDAVDALEVVDRVEFEHVPTQMDPPLRLADPDTLAPFALDPGQLRDMGVCVLPALPLPDGATVVPEGGLKPGVVDVAPTAAPSDPSAGAPDVPPQPPVASLEPCPSIEPMPGPPAD